jgi:hypothetical protein
VGNLGKEEPLVALGKLVSRTIPININNPKYRLENWLKQLLDNVHLLMNCRSELLTTYIRSVKCAALLRAVTSAWVDLRIPFYSCARF